MVLSTAMLWFGLIVGFTIGLGTGALGAIWYMMRLDGPKSRSQ